MRDNPYKSPADTSKPIRDRRPVTATLFGVLNIVFGIVGSLFSVMGLAMLALAEAGVVPQPALPPILQNPTLQRLGFVNGVIGVFLPILLVAAGVGLLKFRSWGRRLSNWWAGASLLLLLISTAIQVNTLVLPVLNSLESVDLKDPNEAGMFFGALGGVLGGCFGALYPVALLIFMNREQFREQLAWIESTELSEMTVDGPAGGADSTPEA